MESHGKTRSMKEMDPIEAALHEASRTLEAFRSDAHSLEGIAAFVREAMDTLAGGGTILCCGNGGSLCDAMHFAEELVGRFHSRAEASRAHEEFVARFRKGALPDEMPELRLPGDGDGLPIANLLKAAGLVASTSEALRMIKQGAVKIDGQRLEDRGLVCRPGSSAVYQVGKRRFARVLVE